MINPKNNLKTFKRATVFEFLSYKFEPNKKRVIFNYKTNFLNQNPIFFSETVILPQKIEIGKIPKEAINKLLKSLHIILGISYFKFYCATKIELKYDLTKNEADFWNTVYKKGLGEFFYKNKLNPKFNLFKAKSKKEFSAQGGSAFGGKNINVLSSLNKDNKNNRCLVGIGGGKDSIVVSELLKSKKDIEITGFRVETGKESDLVSKVIKQIGINDLKIIRILDKKVYENHLYNGHIPISSIYAFLGVFTALLYNYSYLIVGNEYSSNFGNIKYKGESIYPVKSAKGGVSPKARQFNWVNHQWSKSYEFEKLFQNYIHNFIDSDIFYFSLLRSFYEIRIVEIFSKYKKYFKYFSSCNKNFSSIQKIHPVKSAEGGVLLRAKQFDRVNSGLWCNKCPKCLFVFLIMSAFITKKELINIFGKNLYKEEKLLPLFKDILGLGNMKPFDCVGTFEESQTALFMARPRFNNDFIMRQVGKKAKYFESVFKTQKESSIPEKFKFLGMKNALILGYGKEGKITKKYLEKYHPNLKIGIADSKQGNGYLKKQTNFSAGGGPASGWDIAVKTPGLNKEFVEIPYTTATNLFFSKIKGQNLIIGVTGSKGKSTTASLIYEILKSAGKRVELLGNIGKPMLESLLSNTKNQTPKIYVLELSSYQLDDIKFSPDIAVVTNLFPEHLDYHHNVKNYYQAKKNIINFSRYARSGEARQNRNFFVYKPTLKEMGDWIKNYNGQAIPFSNKVFQSNLLGEHNKNNIKAAVSVAKILKIKDKVIEKAIKKFKGLPHRLELVGEFKGIKFYDDAISTTPESTIEALKSLKNIDTILLGGKDRGYNFLALEKEIKNHKIKNIVLFPDSGNKIIKDKKYFNIKNTSKMEEAVKFAYQNTRVGGICLLSCASPSYSLWKNFEEKGDQFKYFVHKLSKDK